MSSPSSRRVVFLLRESDRQLVRASLYRDYPSHELNDVQGRWGEARVAAAIQAQVEGLAPLEHGHWDWRHKADSVEAGYHMILAVDAEEETQGLMAVLRTPRPGRLGGGPVVYVDYLEVAPWNLRGLTVAPKYLGVGTVLIAEAVRLSLEMGLGGRVGLHSLPQAESFYASRCRMSRVGPDPRYYDLVYFEYTQQQAADWLSSIGGSQ